MAENLVEARAKKGAMGDLGGGAGRARTRPRGPVEAHAPRMEHCSKTRIPKSVRYELENALVGLCDVWFEEIKPHLLKNNIKVHVHGGEGLSGRGGGEGAGGDRRPAGAPGCSHIDPGAASDLKQPTNVNCADSYLSRRPTSRARYRKQLPPPSRHQSPPHLTKETQKYLDYDEKHAPPPWLPLVAPVGRRRRRRSPTPVLLNTQLPSKHVVPRLCKTSIDVPPLELHKINKKKHKPRKKVEMLHQTQEPNYITETKTKASQTQELPPQYGEFLRRDLLYSEIKAVNVMINGCQMKVESQQSSCSPTESQLMAGLKPASLRPPRWKPRRARRRTRSPSPDRQRSVQLSPQPVQRHSTASRRHDQQHPLSPGPVRLCPEPSLALGRLTISPQRARQHSPLFRPVRQRSASRRPAPQRSPLSCAVRQASTSPQPLRPKSPPPRPIEQHPTSLRPVQQRLGALPQSAGHIMPSSYKRQITKSRSPSRRVKTNHPLVLQCQNNDNDSPLFEDDLIEIIGASHDKVVKQLNTNSKRYCNRLNLKRSPEERASSKKIIPWR